VEVPAGLIEQARCRTAPLGHPRSFPMGFLDVGVGHCSSWRRGSSWSGRCCWRQVLLPRSSTVEVAASPAAVCLWPELALQLHEAPDPGAVGMDVGLDAGGHLCDGGQVDAEQLRAPLQRRRDRPAQVRVVPSPHRSSLSNRCSEPNRECYLPRPDGPLGHIGAQSPGLHGSTADNPVEVPGAGTAPLLRTRSDGPQHRRGHRAGLHLRRVRCPVRGCPCPGSGSRPLKG
jgi:hypothetical protein